MATDIVRAPRKKTGRNVAIAGGVITLVADGRGARDVPRLAGARPRRCARIWSITEAWVMHTMIRMVPRHVGHASGSTSKICCRSAAQRRAASVGASRGCKTSPRT